MALPLRPEQAADRTTEFNKGLADGLALLRRTSLSQALADWLARLTTRQGTAPARTASATPAPAEPDWHIVVDPSEMRRLAGVPSAGAGAGVAADKVEPEKWVTRKVVETRFGSRYVGNLAAWFQNASRHIENPGMASFIRKSGSHYEYELTKLEDFFERTGRLCDPAETRPNLQALQALQALPVVGRTVHRCR